MVERKIVRFNVGFIDEESPSIGRASGMHNRGSPDDSDDTPTEDAPRERAGARGGGVDAPLQGTLLKREGRHVDVLRSSTIPPADFISDKLVPRAINRPC